MKCTVLRFGPERITPAMQSIKYINLNTTWSDAGGAVRQQRSSLGRPRCRRVRNHYAMSTVMVTVPFDIVISVLAAFHSISPPNSMLLLLISPTLQDPACLRHGPCCLWLTACGFWHKEQYRALSLEQYASLDLVVQNRFCFRGQGLAYMPTVYDRTENFCVVSGPEISPPSGHQLTWSWTNLCNTSLCVVEFLMSSALQRPLFFSFVMEPTGSERF